MYICGIGRSDEGVEMTTWREEFSRLSDIERDEIEKWKAGENNSNILINAGEATRAFLIQYQAAGQPPRDQEMPVW